jgi:hypothetical protein
MNKTYNENNSKIKWLYFAIYAIACSLYLILDYAKGEGVQVIFNLFLVFGITSLFSICLRYVFEIFLIKFVAYCTKNESLTLKKVIDISVGSSLIPAIGMALGIIIRILFGFGENAAFQSIWMGVAHTPYYIYVFYKLNAFKPKMAMKIVLIVYFVLYWVSQIAPIFTA